MNTIGKIVVKSFLYIMPIILMHGCAGDKILYKTYAPPHELNKVKEMQKASSATSGYLDIEVLNKIQDASLSDESFNKKLVANMKKFLTQTNFIKVSTIKNEGSLLLTMKILTYEYKQSSNNIDGQISVEFTIYKNAAEDAFYTKTYAYNIKRYSRGGVQSLPSKNEILSQASKYLAKKVIKDISPIATRKLVELKSLPDDMKYTLTYMKQKNYEGAVKAMLNYKGEKDANYYFDLAVYYEALASETNDIKLLAKADEFYTKSMTISKGRDEVIVKGKGKFDNYYRIVKQVAEQKLKNAKNNNDSQYDIL